MSISAVNRVSQVSPQQAGSKGITSMPAATTFSQELDARGAKTGPVHGDHHGGGSHSVTSSTATAASAAGAPPLSTIASALQHLLG